MPSSTRLKILFLCKGNSCRSQMAEGWTKALKAGQIEAYSAGMEARGLDPCAVRAMAEAEVDISGQHSKRLSELDGIRFDYVITVCSLDGESCPAYGGNTQFFHFSFDDPPQLAAHAQNDEEQMAPYRRVRDEIRQFIYTLPGCLNS